MRVASYYLYILFAFILLNGSVVSQTLGDYRSIGSGAWGNISIWERFDGTGWVAAAHVPTSADETITVSDSVAITSSISVDQLIVAASGMLVVLDGQQLTIPNGSGTDLTVEGVVTLDGMLTFYNSTNVDGAGTINNNDTLSVYDGVPFLCNIINNGYMFLNGNSSYSGLFTTNAGSVIDIVSGANHRYAFITFATGFTNHGLIRMAGYRDSWGNPILALLTITTGTLVNAVDGTIQTIEGHGADRVISGALTNEGTIAVDYLLTLNKPKTVYENTGTITIDGTRLTVSGDSSVFTNTGTITAGEGKYVEVISGATFIPSDGALTGTVKIINAKLGSGILPNTSSYVLQECTTPDDAVIHNYGFITIYSFFSVNGLLHTYDGSRIRVESGTNNSTGILTLAHGLINNGTLEMIAYADGWGNPRTAFVNSDSAIINAPTGVLITEKGSGAGRELNAPLINQGTITINYILSVKKSYVNDTSSGTIAINGPYLSLSGTSSTFTNTGTITMSDSSFIDVTGGLRFVPSNGTLSGTLNITNAELGAGTISHETKVVIQNSSAPADATIDQHGEFHIYGLFTVNGILNTYTDSYTVIESGSRNETGTFYVVKGFTNHGSIEMIAFNDGWGNPRTATLRADSLILNATDGAIRTYPGTGATRVIDAPFQNDGIMELNWGITFAKGGANNGQIYPYIGPITVQSNALTNNGLIDCRTNIVTGYGNFENSATGVLRIGSPAGITTSSSLGNVQVSGTRTFNPSGFYIYAGEEPQVTGDGIPTNVSHVSILNDSGVTLSKTITVDTLNLLRGILQTGTDTVIMGANGFVGRDSGWIDGYLKKEFTGSGSKVFELGTANGYSPLTVDVKVGMGPFLARAVQGFHPNDPGNTLARYWKLSASGLIADLTFSYLDIDVVGSDTDLVFCKYDTAWSYLSGTVNPDSNTATITGVSSFSDWTFRSMTVAPFGLILFQGYEFESFRVRLEWSTSYETDNLGFYVERKSASGEYETVSEFIPGAGTEVGQVDYSWVDSTLIDTSYYSYRLKQVSGNGDTTYSRCITVPVHGPDDVADEPLLPTTYSLSQNYPNPFNPSTTIGFSLPAGSYVTLIVYDVLGREVSTLVDGMQNAGFKTVQWDASGLPSGIYLYRIQAGTFSETKRLLLTK